MVSTCFWDRLIVGTAVGAIALTSMTSSSMSIRIAGCRQKEIHDSALIRSRINDRITVNALRYRCACISTYRVGVHQSATRYHWKPFSGKKSERHHMGMHMRLRSCNMLVSGFRCQNCSAQCRKHLRCLLAKILIIAVMINLASPAFNTHFEERQSCNDCYAYVQPAVTKPESASRQQQNDKADARARLFGGSIIV